MFRKVCCVASGVVCVVSLAGAVWLVLEAANGPLPLSSQEERAAVGGDQGLFHVCGSTPIQCPACCLPPTSCTLTAGGGCAMAGGRAGCGTGFNANKFECKWTILPVSCYENDFSRCGNPLVPSCPAPIVGPDGFPTCPPGMCSPGPVNGCGSC